MNAQLMKFAAFLCCGFVVAGAQAADLGGLGKDGWHTWRVAAVDPAPAWCCMDWRSGNPQPQACNLDKGDHGFSADQRRPNTTGRMQIYARIKNGEASRILTLSPQCPIVNSPAVVDLGVVETQASVRWLSARIGATDDLSSAALAAIATHDGELAATTLVKTARDATRDAARRDAIFWMGQLRVQETGRELEALMFDDNSADIREHAAFSLSQSAAANRDELLIRLGREDRTAQVRSQAWFWLAQTGAADAEVVIGRALLEDPNKDVREEAVFALSQLPGDRAVMSLIAILENRELPRELRERALFWLAQSDSDVAYEKIQQLLAAQRRGS